MGTCCGTNNRLPIRDKITYKVDQLSQTQVEILRLIYSDLADRTVERKINLQNFILFFHKNGLWGQRLYREFDFGEDNIINQQQFLTGIARIFKSEEKQKIHLLYKFFSRQEEKNEQGVRYKDFLAMLYNYPKRDLKEILNDKDFIQFELQKNMLKGHLKRSETLAYINNYPKFGKKDHSYFEQGVLSENSIHRMTEHSQTSLEITSIVGEHIIENLKTKPHETIIKFKDGNDVFAIKTSNIQQIVKEFGAKIFSDAKVDRKTGRLNFDQFYNWVISHKALYQNYYESFHYQVWGIDSVTKKPGFLSKIPENKSNGRLILSQANIQIQMYLFHSILVLCEQQSSNPICIICLQGLAVDRIYDTKYGFGISITHRDRIYIQKKIFFKNEELLIQWLQYLKFYKGESIHQKYTIGQKIGAGKFSVVYKCKHNIQNKQYALKQIATYKLQKQSIDLIAHQSSIMKIISHPLLIGFKQTIQTKNHIYIVTQYVDGLDLFQFVKQRKYLSQYQGAKIAQMIIVGVSYLHSLGIIHRDLKPENIMVQNYIFQVVENQEAIDVIKIIDFGFSNYLSELRRSHAGEIIVGTPNYIAPQLLKEQEFDFKIDNFAIGAIIYYVLTGNLPFNDFSIGQILKNTMNGQYKFPQRRAISQSGKDLIDKLLQNDPKNRFTLPEALSHPWFQILKMPQVRDDRRKSTIINI